LSIAWNDTAASGTVIDADEWNNMVNEIEHNSNGSEWYNMDADSDIILDAHSSIYMKDDGTQMFKFSYASNTSTIEGGSAGGDDLIIKANSNDSHALIGIEGVGDIDLDIHTDRSIFFEEAGTQFAEFIWDSDNHKTIVYGGTTSGDDMQIYANDAAGGGDAYPYIFLGGGSYIDLNSRRGSRFIYGAGDVISLVSGNAAGSRCKVFGPDAGGNVLQIYANLSDKSPYIGLSGGASIHLNTPKGVRIKPTTTAPTTAAGTLWCSGSTSYCALFMCTSNGGSWKQLSLA